MRATSGEKKKGVVREEDIGSSAEVGGVRGGRGLRGGGGPQSLLAGRYFGRGGSPGSPYGLPEHTQGRSTTGSGGECEIQSLSLCLMSKAAGMTREKRMGLGLTVGVVLSWQPGLRGRLAVWTVPGWGGRRGSGEFVGDLGVKPPELSWLRLGVKETDWSEGLAGSEDGGRTGNLGV